MAKGRSKGKAKGSKPPPCHLWLFISNSAGQGSKRSYKAYGGDWHRHLTSLLPPSSRLLEGVQVVPNSPDTRLTVACTSREHRAALLSALRATSSVRASPFLSVEEKEGKKFTYQLAK